MQKFINFDIDTTFDSTKTLEYAIFKGDTITLTIKVFNKGVLADLTNQIVDLVLLKADGNPVEGVQKTISNGVITATLTQQATLCEGIVRGTLQIAENSTSHISTNEFTYLVLPSISETVLEASRAEINTLSDLLLAIKSNNDIVTNYQTVINQVAGTTDSVQALATIESYIQTNLPALQSANTQAIQNISDETAQNTQATQNITDLGNANTIALNTKNTLDTSNTTALATKNALDTSNTNANATKAALDTSNANATATKNALDTSNTTATATKNALDASNSQAVTNKSLLDTANTRAENNISALNSFGDATTLTQDVTAVKNEVTTARGTASTLNDRLNGFDTSLSQKANKSDIDYTTLGLTLDIAKTNFKLDTYTGAIKNNLSDMIVDVLNDDSDIDKSKSMAYGTNKNLSYIDWYKYNSKNYVKNGVSIVDDFAGKVTGSVTENPNIMKNTNELATLQVITGAFTEENQTQYDNVKTLNGTCNNHVDTGSTHIPQQLFSFNLIEIIQRKYGTIPGSDTASKATWLKANLNSVVCKWYGYGTCPSGNKAVFCPWNSNSSAWGVNWTSHNINAVSYLGVNLSSFDNYITADGFVHFLAYTDASDGTTRSVIYTDYINIEITLKPQTGYDLLVPTTNRRDSGLDTLIQYKQDGTVATNFITSATITPSLVQHQDHTDIYWKADILASVPNKVWITADETLGTGTIAYQVSRDNGVTFTTVVKDTLTDISAQPSGQNLVIKATITGNATLNAISWGWK